MSPSLEASGNYSWPCQRRPESLEMQAADNCLVESVTNGKYVSRVVWAGNTRINSRNAVFLRTPRCFILSPTPLTPSLTETKGTLWESLQVRGRRSMVSPTEEMVGLSREAAGLPILISGSLCQHPRSPRRNSWPYLPKLIYFDLLHSHPFPYIWVLRAFRFGRKQSSHFDYHTLLFNFLKLHHV